MKFVCPLVTVSDIAVSKKFYQEVLGRKIKQDNGENVLFEGDFAIHLKPHFSGLIGRKAGPPGNSFELFFEHDDVDAFAGELVKRGVRLVHEVREEPWRQKVVRFFDPDGNIIEVGETPEFLACRLANEGKTVKEIAAVLNLPESFAAGAIRRNAEKKMKIEGMKYHHVGIPTRASIPGEVYLKDYKVYHYGYEQGEFGIEWMRYEDDCPLPELVKTVPHIAFEVDDVCKAIRGRKVLIEPNSPSEGNIVAFIEEDGAPIEFIQTRK